MLATPSLRFIAVVVVGLALPLALWLYVSDWNGPTRPPSSATERAAVEVARGYVRGRTRFVDAAKFEGRIRDVHGQWEVNFPSPRSVAKGGGPIITMDKASNRVLAFRASD